jgi:hypothetical protein
MPHMVFILSRTIVKLPYWWLPINTAQITSGKVYSILYAYLLTLLGMGGGAHYTSSHRQLPLFQVASRLMFTTTRMAMSDF